MATALLKLTDVQLGTSVTATNNFTIYQPASPDGTVRWGVGNSGSVTDIVTLNSSGYVGIGTSSPTDKLTVATSAAFNVNGTTDVFKFFSGGAGLVYAGTTTASAIGFLTSGTERMRLDSSGNLGLGVTPSAWYSASKAMQLGATGVIEGRSGIEVFQLGSNWYINSAGTSYIYTTTGPSTRYSTTGGAHYWYNAPSGTAGNAITFTQAMTLDASGNLGIGTSSPASRLTLSTATNNGLYLTDGTVATILYNSSSSFGTLGTLTNHPMTIWTNNSERMRIDSSGNVGIGTSSPGAKLHITGAYGTTANTALRLVGTGQTTGDLSPIAFYLQSSNWGTQHQATITAQQVSGTDGGANLIFGTSADGSVTTPTERMRITSTGLLQFNSGYGSVATAYGCRAWVNFNGTGTVAIRASGNVSSITDNGTGQYTVNFSTAMPDANYAVASTLSRSGLATATPTADGSWPAATGSFALLCANASNAVFDPPAVLATVFR